MWHVRLASAKQAHEARDGFRHTGWARRLAKQQVRVVREGLGGVRAEIFRPHSPLLRELLFGKLHQEKALAHHRRRR
eukprot:CAMPEP_0205917408 /NCGR_PEP_ID=MMETSP1325-20131115/9144_1 /ASSEMBLY_ACC=CAM_ASM_000708 /TAXON_ID=236786 /ORGANISM="Florenciella sp., Strain RCC1007" /LENGTH=76 /DNA_ID=CAMNT_0053284825 /DNA_START=51 /DNA_END=277 /DNA_ORIENTATION=+